MKGFLMAVIYLMVMPWIGFAVYGLAMWGYNWSRERFHPRWLRLPEVLRWILFAPVLFLVWGVAGLLFHFLILAFEPLLGFWYITRLLASLLAACFMASMFFPLQFSLTPRHPVGVGWCFYTVAAGGAIVVLLSAPLLMFFGRWTSEMWRDLATSLAWLWAGSKSFFAMRATQKEQR